MEENFRRSSTIFLRKFSFNSSLTMRIETMRLSLILILLPAVTSSFKDLVRSIFQSGRVSLLGKSFTWIILVNLSYFTNFITNKYLLINMWIHTYINKWLNNNKFNDIINYNSDWEMRCRNDHKEDIND